MQNKSYHTVLVTRPRDQAADLIAAINSLGKTALACPSLEIKPLHPKLPSLQSPASVILFNSANAVCFGIPLLKQQWPDFASQATLLAQGPGTAAALIASGLTDVITAPAPYDSEAVLTLPLWQEPRTVMLIRGRGGRPWLQQQLQQAEHRVFTLEVYERHVAAIDFDRVLGEHRDKIDLIISTSQESLQALYQQATGAWRNWLLARALLVISSAMREKAQQLGFANSIIVADNASTKALLAALETPYG